MAQHINETIDEDTLWSVARLEVMTENGIRLNDSDYAFWNTDTRTDCWRDDRYSEILECQFDNYRADPDSFVSK